MPETNFVGDLSGDGLEWLRAGIITIRGEVTNFTAQYETIDEGE
jgi:hypothetical protein